jgi:hypothetical protein
MNREIMKIVNRVVSEEFSGRISNIKNRLFENKGSEMCEACGSGDMYEGECMECGNMYEGNIQELGGMDDGHPRFGKKRLPNKMSIEDIENLLRGDDDTDADDDENDYRDLSMYNPYYGDDANMYADDDENDYRDLSMYNPYYGDDANMYGDDVEIDNFDELGEDVCEECEDTYEIELDEKLYGNQSRIDRNKNNRIDREDFEMLRKESKVYFTESEIIDIIENIVKEEKKKGKAPSAQNILKSTLGQSKKENEENIKRVAKKMKEYLKDGSKGDYEMDPTNFPEGNYDLDKRKESLKKYTPSEAVDEYIDAFSYPGQTNLRFDEIKPDDKRIKKYLKGDRTTGNAQVDDDGNALGNVVPSDVGEKFFKNFEENLYGHEQADASYKRYSQPVDFAGEETERGTLKSKRGKKTAQSVLNAVGESTEEKKVILEMGKIKNLIGYNRKTQ